MSDILTILSGEFVEQSKAIPDASVHLVVTSPPYDNLRTYDDMPPFDFEGVARAIERVLSPGGVLCWNVNDSVVEGSETLTSCEQKIFFRRELGLRIHDTMIYEKTNPSNPSTTRYNQVSEYVFVFSKGPPSTFNPIKDKKNTTVGTSNLGIHTKRNADGSFGIRNQAITQEFGMRGNIWRGKTRGREDMCQSLPHPAMMPKWLARDLIISWSNAGDIVLDPMAGSGTVGAEAIQLGRTAILCDRNPAYVELMKRACDVTPGFAL